MYGYVARIAAGAMIATANLSMASAFPSAASMQEGGYALAPFSFVKFCLDYPSDCPKSAGPRRVRLTSGRMAELSNVNRAVNASIRPKADTSRLRYWRLDVDAGDCNAFAVQKRHELIRRGWPAAALALTVAKTARGEGHLVVTVRTDQGDLVLDNLRSNIVPWQKAGYQWIMRQSERNPQFWVELNGGRAGPVGAAQDLGDATEIAEADLAQAPNAQRVDAEALPAAVGAAKAPAAQASIAGLTRWIDGNRQAAAPLLDRVVAALDRLIETIPTSPAKPLEEDERAAMAADAVDATRFGFV